MDKYNKYFHFPQGVVNQISECSPNGFILFYVDNLGQPKMKVDFNSQMAEMCLRSYAEKILAGISEVEESGIAESLFKQLGGEEEEETGN